MSNRQILLLLVILTAGAAGGRQWAKGYHDLWDEALVDHKKRYVSIIENALEVKERRDPVLEVAAGNSSYQSQLQQFAVESSSLGNITVKPQGDPDGDLRLTVEFEDPEHRYDRSQLASFLYNAEGRIPRLRTTQFTIRPAGSGGRGKVKTGAEREDTWHVDRLIFTKRSPTQRSN